MVKLAAAFPPSFLSPNAVADKTALWREDILDANRWITPAIFAKGVRLIVRTVATSEYLPPPGQAIDHFRQAKLILERDAAHAAAEATARQATVTEVTPTPIPTPGIHPDGRPLLDSLAEKERRIDAEKEAAREYLRRKFGKGSAQETLLDRLARPLSTGQRRVTRVEWADGEVSEVEQIGQYQKPLSERAQDPENKAILKRYAETKPYNDVDFARDHPDHVEPWPPRPSAADVWPTMRDDEPEPGPDGEGDTAA